MTAPVEVVVTLTLSCAPALQAALPASATQSAMNAITAEGDGRFCKKRIALLLSEGSGEHTAAPVGRRRSIRESKNRLAPVDQAAFAPWAGSVEPPLSHW